MLQKRYIYLFLSLILIINSASAATYFVDSENGSDLNNGTTEINAWKTLAKVSSVTLSPGDIVLLKRGGTWREQLNIRGSGVEGLPITFGAYGSGNAPEILGSESIAGWTEVSPDIWKADLAASVNWLWFISDGNINWGNKVSSLGYLQNEFDFFTASKAVYVYSNGNPLPKYHIEGSVREYGIIGTARNYINVENLNFRFLYKAGIKIERGNNWIISGNTFSYSGENDTEKWGDGVMIYGSNNIIRNNTSYENSHSGFAVLGYGLSCYDNIIESNVVYNNYHNNIDIKSNETYFVHNLVVRYNTIFCTDDFTRESVNGVFLQGNNDGSKVVNSLVCYNLIFNPTASGVQVSVYTEGTQVYNNTIYKPRGVNSACVYMMNGPASVIVMNNIGMNAVGRVLRMEETTNKFINNNLWYQDSQHSQYIARIGSTNYTNWEIYKSATGFDQNSIWGKDPLFNNAPADFSLRDGSPAVDAGTDLGLGFDIYGNIISGKSDLGAFETPEKNLNLRLKVFLQGAFSSGKMKTMYASSGVFPMQNPYNQNPWNYSGNESISSTASDLVDWVLVEIRRGLSVSTAVARKALLLYSDGTIKDQNGSDVITFEGIAAGNYYVLIRHRNHLSVISSSAVSLNSNPVLVDFSLQSSAYGNNSLIQLSPGLYGMIAGDSNADGVVNLNDFISTGEKFFLNGYHNADLDMNQKIDIFDFQKSFFNLYKASQITD